MSVAKSVCGSIASSVASSIERVGAASLEYDFNGTTGSIEFPAAVTANTGTIATTFKLDSIPADLTTLVDAGSTGTGGLMIWASLSSTFRIQYGTGATGSALPVAGVVAGVVYRGVLAWTPSTVKFYLDGVLKIDKSDAAITAVAAQKLWVGSQGGTTRYMNGQLRNLEVYSDAKDASWVADDLAGSKSVTNRTLLLNCSDYNPTVAPDASGLGNNGTKTAGVTTVVR